METVEPIEEMMKILKIDDSSYGLVFDKMTKRSDFYEFITYFYDIFYINQKYPSFDYHWDERWKEFVLEFFEESKFIESVLEWLLNIKKEKINGENEK